MAKKKEQMRMLIEQQQNILAAARNAGRAMNEEELSRMEELQREIGELSETAGEGDPENTPPSNEGQRAIEEERSRMTEIFEMCRDFDIDAGDYIRSGVSVETVRKEILKTLKEKRGPVTSGVRTENTGEENFRRDMADGMMLRSGVAVENPTTEARGFSGASLRDMAIMCLSRDGQNVNELLRMSGDDIYVRMVRQFYNPTSAFPAILDTAIQKSIVKIYQDVPTTFQEWTGEGTLRDFKTTDDHSYIIGGSGDLLLVPENGELKADTPKTDKLPTRKLDTYGRQFSMSRQAFINDDIGFLTEVPAIYAARTKRQINRMCYRVLYNNETIFDGKTLFHTDHGNLMETGSEPTVDSLKAMLVKMMTQKDPFGESINVVPETVIVPVGYEFLLDVLFNSDRLPGSANNDINPLRNRKMKVVSDGELNALAGSGACPWFMAANWMTARGIQVDYLNGQKQPTIRRGEKPGTLGFVWDIYMDWGISVRDFRGFLKNPGVKL